MATRPLLVITFARETPFFGDETFSRRLARETPFFADEAPSRRLFEPENSLFWRRDPFTSSF
ncbi:hypothetical protein M4A92_18295 [Caldibacillus thermoamylovorans]|nr:hypothetical protein [Caldibacillus thermoamylovorans]